MLFNVFKPRKKRVSIKQPDISEFTGELYARQPRVKLLSNGTISDFLCDSGTSFIKTIDCDLTSRPCDLLRKPKGVFCYASYKDKTICATYAPNYMENVEYETAFSKSAVSYFARTDDLKITTQVRLHSLIGYEQREYLFENRSQEVIELSLSILLEPSFEPEVLPVNNVNSNKDAAIEVLWDKDSNAVTISSPDAKNHLAVGFLENKPFLVKSKPDKSFETDKSEKRNDIELKSNQIAIDFSLELEKQEEKSLHLLLVFGKTKAEALSILKAVKNQPAVDNNSCAKNKHFENPISKRIAQTLLPQLLFSKRDSGVHLDFAFSNTATLDDLSSIAGISKELPIVTVDIYSQKDKDRVLAYVQSYLYLKKSFLDFYLVFVYDGMEETQKAISTVVFESLADESPLYRRNIAIIPARGLTTDKYNLVHAAACHLAARSMVRIEVPSPKFTPIFSEDSDYDIFDQRCGALCLTQAITAENDPATQKGDIIKLNENKAIDGIDISSKVKAIDDNSILIDISIKNNSSALKSATLFYYNELLFGKDRHRGNMIKGEYKEEDNILILFNPIEKFDFKLLEDKNINGRWLAITTSNKKSSFCCDRANFLSGNTDNNSFPPLYEPCLVTIFNCEIEASKKEDISIIISFGKTKADVLSVLRNRIANDG